MLSQEHPFLGIDYGKRRIGISASDKLGILVHPVCTIHTQKENPFERISEIAKERKIQGIVIGLPLYTNGEESEICSSVRHFRKKLSKILSKMPIYFQNETFSSQAAESKLRQNPKFNLKKKRELDQFAAIEILQDWLENMKYLEKCDGK